jgi:hypothetical protein
LRSALLRVIAKPDVIDAWRDHLPSEFDPLRCWREFERACCELSVEGSLGIGV